MKLEKKHWYWIAGIATVAVTAGALLYRRKVIKAKQQAEIDRLALEAIKHA